MSRARTVALVGSDGCGKSTQAERLRRHLEAGGARVLIVHPYGRKLLPRPRRLGVERQAVGPGLAARAYAVADVAEMAAYLWLAHLRAALRRRPAWIVGDRSFDDVLTRHERVGSLGARTLRLARRLAPRFALTIWLDVRPDVACRRDGDHSRAFHEASARAYAAAAHRYGWHALALNGETEDEVFARIRDVLAGRDLC